MTNEMTITITEEYRCDDMAVGGWAVTSDTHIGIGATKDEARFDIAFATFGYDIDPSEVTFK